MEQFISKYLNQIILLVGLGYSVYYNVRSNKEKTQDNKEELQAIKEHVSVLEQNTNAFMTTINKLLDINATFNESIRRVHEKIDEVKDDFVHKDTCQAIRDSVKRQ